MTDRRVHAVIPFRAIVRYERAGKWYLEPTDSRGPKRRHITVTQAANLAARYLGRGDGRVFFNRPGGQTFDSKVRTAMRTYGVDI